MIEKDATKPISFENWLISRELGERTRKQYLRFVKMFKAFGDDQITQNIIDNFLVKYRHSVARASVSNYLEFSKVKKEYDLPRRRGRKKEGLPKYLPFEDIERLAGYFDKPRNYLLVKLMYEGGLRVSEVLNIRKRDIDLKERRIKVVGKGKKERRVNFSDETRVLLSNYIERLSPENKVFPIGEHWVWVLIKKAGHKALGKKVHPHMLRHSIATHLLNIKGLSKEKIGFYLGHDDPRSTAIYAKVDSKKVEVPVKEFLG